MSKKLALLAIPFMAALAVSATNKVQPSDEGYNLLSLSYDATINVSSLSPFDELEAIPGNFTLNGMSINYLRGFHLPMTKLPMFVELGASIGFNNGKYTDESYNFHWSNPLTSRTTQMYRNFNLEVPIFYLYRFQTSRRFSIAPFAGFNFKLHLASTYKEKWESNVGGSYEKDEYDWESCYGESFDNQWKRFQVGFGGGVRIALDNKWIFSTQFVWDLNPVLNYKDEMEQAKVHTGTLRFAVGYKF